MYWGSAAQRHAAPRLITHMEFGDLLISVVVEHLRQQLAAGWSPEWIAAYAAIGGVVPGPRVASFIGDTVEIVEDRFFI